MSGSGQQVDPIALTLGDPAGIGGEIATRAWHATRKNGAPFFIVGDIEHAVDTATMIGLEAPVRELSNLQNAADVFREALPIVPLSRRVEGRPSRPMDSDAACVIESIERATALCREGLARAVVTNPINKKRLYGAGFRFPGHTEFIADLCGSPGAVMMLAAPDLRVVPVTIHLPLRDAVSSLTTEEIVRVGRIAADALRADFGIAAPRIAVSGLNPHAGEEGALGNEDEDIIRPAVHALRSAGIEAEGPVPGDALFTPRRRATFDAAVCMYHDQALIPIKALDFDRAVNVTLGLPIVRTSPDHGTAFDIAGRGIAQPDSLIAALAMADAIAAHRAVARRPRNA
ncbi:MAG: 4-hydroxythreonine-4-phosphate dehydrogenase PdxA [Rhodospirillales bacterium]